MVDPRCTTSRSSMSNTSVAPGGILGQRAPVSIGDGRGADELRPPAGLHLLHALGPARDDLVEPKLRRLSPLVGAVEFDPVDEATPVVHPHRIHRRRRGADPLRHRNEDEPRLERLGPGGLGGLLGVRLPPLLLVGEALRAPLRLQLAKPRRHVFDLTLHRVRVGVAQTLLDLGELLLREGEGLQCAAEGDAQGVEHPIQILPGRRGGPHRRISRLRRGDRHHRHRKNESKSRHAPSLASPPTLVTRKSKRRGVCPSCNARRAHDTTIHLEAAVLPRRPYRPWTLSFPMRLRFLLARDEASLRLRPYGARPRAPRLPPSPRCHQVRRPLGPAQRSRLALSSRPSPSSTRSRRSPSRSSTTQTVTSAGGG